MKMLKKSSGSLKALLVGMASLYVVSEKVGMKRCFGPQVRKGLGPKLVYCMSEKGNEDFNPTKRLNFVADVVEIAEPAVVSISVVDKRFVDFSTRKPLSVSNGSGFIVKSNGCIITNAHVVGQPNTHVVITLKDGRIFDGHVDVVDMHLDLALIRIQTAEQLPFLTMGDSKSVRNGEFVVAVGSPLTLSNTVTFGIVSSSQRASEELGLRGKAMNYIQTDAAINSGNSGGPLINLDGHVIGVNSMKVTAGISFAIPIDYVKEFIDSASKKSDTKAKSKPRVYLGLRILTLTPEIIGEFQIRNNLLTHVTHGVLVWKIMPNSPAFNAGIKHGDVIVEINGTKIQSSSDVFRLLESANASFDKTITILLYSMKIGTGTGSKGAQLHAALVSYVVY